jgi:hypothetical protein
MTQDDMLAYLASKPKKNRPAELRSDSRMVYCWLRLRKDRDFLADVILRHNLLDVYALDESNPTHEHAISNAWSHCMQVLTEKFLKENLGG